MASNGFTSKDLLHSTMKLVKILVHIEKDEERQEFFEDTKKTFIAQNKKYENVFKEYGLRIIMWNL